MLTMTFGRQVVDRKPFVVRIERDNVYADLRILFLEFWYIFQLDRKCDSVKIYSVLIFGVSVNTIQVAFRWV